MYVYLPELPHQSLDIYLPSTVSCYGDCDPQSKRIGSESGNEARYNSEHQMWLGIKVRVGLGFLS